MKDSLFLYQKKSKLNNIFLENLSVDYVDIYKKSDDFQDKITKYIEKYNIKHIFIYFDNCDASLDIYELDKIKETYDLYFVFIFLNHYNSFEYIDRYYAQLADMVVLDDVQYIEDFYEFLSCPTYSIKNFINNNFLLKKNIFSSCLNGLISIDFNRQYSEPTKQDFLNIKKILANKKPLKPEMLLDKKFIYATDVYKIYWKIYNLKINKNLKSLLGLINLNSFKYLKTIYKIFIYLDDENSSEAFDVINNALFDEEDCIWKQ